MKIIKTKTFWGGLTSIVTGIGIVVCGDKITGVQTIILGVLAIFARDAIAKVASADSTGK
jgi:hypothetical protein